jgi:hypothetical protein
VLLTVSIPTRNMSKAKLDAVLVSFSKRNTLCRTDSSSLSSLSNFCKAVVTCFIVILRKFLKSA